MQWIQSIVMSVAAFFGLGTEAMQPAPVADTEPETQITQTDARSTTSDTAIVSETSVTLEPVDEAEPTQEATEDATESEVAADAEAAAMTGNAKPASVPTAETTAPDIRTAMVAGGCFWCVEADLEKTPGVISVVSGYAGGTTDNPTYENYGDGGHREVVEVTYDANQISYEGILIVTLKTTDPTDDDGTFNDRGDKYSAAFYYENAQQRETIEDLIAEVDAQGPYDKPLAIDVEARPQFWPAEDYHQDYYKGTLTQLKYKYYRNASGRSDFIQQYWGNNVGPTLPWRTNTNQTSMNDAQYPWSNYQKPDQETLKQQLDATTYKVTQRDGTERAGTSPLDKIYEPGIYVDVLSGEPLFSSRDKFDSGTGWPSFVKPITPGAVTEHEDRKLFVTRTEIRSAVADNHLGHVFTDGPEDRGGLRYCMNGVALEFVPAAEMEARGYGDFTNLI